MTSDTDPKPAFTNVRPLSVRRIGAAIVGVCLLTAAVSKAADPGSVTAVAVHLAPDLRWQRHWLVGLVASLAAIECLVGLALLLRPGRFVISSAAIVLAALSAVLIRLSVDHDAPRCGCFGGVVVLASAKSDAVLGLARNAGLMGLLAVSWPAHQPRT